MHEELRNAVEEREALRRRLQEQIQALITYEEAVVSKVISPPWMLSQYKIINISFLLGARERRFVKLLQSNG